MKRAGVDFTQCNLGHCVNCSPMQRDLCDREANELDNKKGVEPVKKQNKKVATYWNKKVTYTRIFLLKLAGVVFCLGWMVGLYIGC